jgi:glycosyltransferase involved in cell wall biosynthesis/predicted O-methyltransferase YrrM
MKVTLYAICKNEEKNVEKFLKNAEKFDDVIVVDTGSTDNTVKLLQDAGIKVFEHPQTREEFDFSLARNTALSYVETDWCLSLDFNEDVSEFNPSGLSAIENEFTYFAHKRFDDKDGDVVESSEVHIRFHRKDNYKWINAVHEHPTFVATENHPQESKVDTTVSITKKINKTVDKELFYLSICQRELEKDPKNWYYIWFTFNHFLSVNNQDLTLDYGQQFLTHTQAYFNSFRIKVFIDCSKILFAKGEVQKAANYLIHAVSESLMLGESFATVAFDNLFGFSKEIGNLDLAVFSSAFSEHLRTTPERSSAIKDLNRRNIDDLHSCWKGHKKFAQWLMTSVKPKVVVDLGVDHGYSTFCFGIPRVGQKVYGIDTFEGDQYAGQRDSDQLYAHVNQKARETGLDDAVTFIKGTFDDVAKEWDKTIDVLHIDGDHAYESVKNDYETWSKFLSEDGVVLFHDTMVENINGNEYGVKRFFEELDLPKVNFTHTFGLGVASKNERLINFIKDNMNLDKPL